MDPHALNPHQDPVAGPSNRTFGLVLAAVFALVGLAPLCRHHAIRGWALAPAATLALAALAYPASLGRLNAFWSRLGSVIHAIVSPVALLAAFVVGVFPTAAMLRLVGKDPLKRGFDPEAGSYWIPRQTGETRGSGMRDQF